MSGALTADAGPFGSAGPTRDQDGIGRTGWRVAEAHRWGEHVDPPHRGVGIVGVGDADAVLVVATGVAGVDQSQGLVPHGIAGEVDGDVPAAAFGLLFDQAGGRALLRSS